MAATKTKRAPKATPKPASTAWSPPAWLLAAGLVLATLVLYWPAMQHGFVNYDDDLYVTQNTQVQKGLTLENIRWAFTQPVDVNWHPLTVLTYMLVCQICGLNPWGHHLAGVLLHAANAALVFILLRRLTGAVWKSFFVAALFAFHPLRVESVAWVAERKDTLSGFFGLLTLICYARYALARQANSKGTGLAFSGAYWLAVFWLMLGLMSKPMLVTWPFVLLLLDYWPLDRYKPGCIKGLLLEKIPFFVLAAAGSIVTYEVQRQGAAVVPIQELPLAARSANALIAYCRYLGKIFWPTDLAVIYPYPTHWPTGEVLLAAGFLIGLTIVLVIQWRRHPYLLMGWLWFVGTLVPVIGLVQVGMQAMADRYTYLPALGILIPTVWGAVALVRLWRFPSGLLTAAGLVAMVVCIGLTRMQLQYWQDGEALFRHTLAVTENNYFAYYNLGHALDEKGRPDEAINEYESIVQAQPSYGWVYVSLGTDMEKAGHTDEAMHDYEEAIHYQPNRPEAHNNLGILLFKRGQNDEAIRQFQEAIRIAPDKSAPHNSLAAVLYRQGEHDEAFRQFQEALRLDPSSAEIHFNFAYVLAERGQTNEAIANLKEALRLNPDYTAARAELSKLTASEVKPN